MVLQGNIRKARSYDIVGSSRTMLEINELIKTVAPTKATVLIEGESGTGKELIARAIHSCSNRKGRPFVAINCPAVADNLWESEMFGHEKGAFTGAVTLKKGRLEMADGGTFFLDEVSEMPIALQAKLLRVLQEMEFERVGGTRTIQVDVRVVAAANKDLRQGLDAGWFRSDLFYRLNVFKIQLPPLRERKEDIPLLMTYFVEKYARENGQSVPGISNRAREVLMDHPFPGNIRELENIMERAVILSKGRDITLQDLPEEVSGAYVMEAEPDLKVKSGEILKALKGVTIPNEDGPPIPWHRMLRCTTIETIHEFLIKTNQKQFSRDEFSRFLTDKAESDKNKYGTAGKYLSILKKNRICVHNGGKANKSGYRLSDVFCRNA